MKDPVKINITFYTCAKALRRVIALTIMVVAPISLGVVVGSSAMQWVGFVFGFIVMLAYVHQDEEKDTFADIAAARARLDQIEREIKILKGARH